MRKITSVLLMSGFLASAFAVPAYADWRHHDDINHFHEHDFDHWRGGRWFSGPHGGRNGWWWIVDGSWYFYPAPVYPFPDPYTPPPGVIVEGVAPAPGISYVYYCANPAGYYPYVPECFGHWHRVVSGTPPSQVVVVETPQAAPPVPPPAPVPVATRETDYAELNRLADEFYHTDLQDPRAMGELTALGKRVEAFRKSLYDRTYNAMKVSKDADDLLHRIADAKKRIARMKAGGVITPPPAQPPAASAPPGGSVPPGATVTFPPQ